MKLVFSVLLVAHWGACFLFYIGMNECSSNGICWLLDYNLLEVGKYQQYVASFYFFIMTMTSVGFGEFNPKTPFEMLYQIFSMILSCGMFTYIVSSMGEILSRRYDAESEFKDKINKINRILTDKEVSESLRVKIRIFLEYKLECKMNFTLDEDEVLGLINHNLTDEIILEINLKLINKFKYFNNFESLCVKISTILIDETIMNNEVIFDVSLLYF